MAKVKFKFKRDKYRKARDGYSKFLDIYCSNCKQYLLLYQKDGPGPLKRLYFDRIFAPKYLADLQNLNSIKEIKRLECHRCQQFIGMPIIYQKENRKSFHLEQGAFIKKVGKGVYPPENASL